MLMHPAFIIFVAVLVLFYLLWFIHSMGSSLSFEKRFMAADMALTVDSLLAAKDNVVLYYVPQNEKFVPKFNYDFDSNVVTVFEGAKDEAEAGVYYFTSDPSIKFDRTLVKFRPPFVLPRFSRRGSTLSVDDGNLPDKKIINIYALSCPKQRFGYGSITFDPAHGVDAKLKKGDSGFTAGKLSEFELTREISSMVKVLDTGKHIGVFTRDADIDLSIDDRKKAVVDSVISLHVGSVKSSDVFVKAYVNYGSKKMNESLKLACELVNAVSSSLLESKVKVSGVAVIPVIPSNEPEQFGILLDDRPAVMLEVGNINTAMFSSDNKKAVASGIIEGVKNAGQ